MRPRDSIHPLRSLVAGQKSGRAVGICSVCSANELVLEAAMECAAERRTYALIEATSNQVNQFGGYTGMEPEDFRVYADRIARRVGLDGDKLILGGDHLGPLVWAGQSAECAMENASELVRRFVRAGFSKIHIDASMRLGGDPEEGRMSQELVARRTVELIAAAQEASLEEGRCEYPPVYVVGSEVPIPGGSVDEKGLTVTRPADLREFWDCFRAQLKQSGMQDLLRQVIAVVVQPGAEFAELDVEDFRADGARELADAIKSYDGIVYEGHSTDYQTAEGLKAMVESGVGILKVGPELTFALREGVFALSRAEEELAAIYGFRSSAIREVMERQMLARPDGWMNHYKGSIEKRRFLRTYSYSDRMRYYWADAEVAAALEQLLENLSRRPIPMVLLSALLPIQYDRIRRGLLNAEPRSLLKDCVSVHLEKYYRASSECL